MRFIKERNGKLLDDLKDLIYREQTVIPSWRMRQGTERVDNDPVLSADKALEDAFSGNSEWTGLSSREVWGGDHEYFLFAANLVVPEEMDGRTVVFRMRTGREGEWDALNPQFLAYLDGAKKQGLDVNHREILIAEHARAGESHTLLLSAYTGDKLFHLLMETDLCILEREVEGLYYDLRVPYDVARLLSPDSEEYMTIMAAITEALNLVDFRVPYSEAFYESIRAARASMADFYETKCGHSPQTVYAVGHSHIDLAWEWTLAVTRDKTVRSFSTVLEYMRQYPDYHFMASQPQEYLYVKELAPDIYAEIKERVKEGRWEPEGAMYVEPDCNLTSGESLVRQIIHGKRFFREEFGIDSRILWLPDVFGYSAALPQILRLGGVDYFMTTKISWNETNMIPYDTFMWEGIDGTRILTHMAPTRDYNAAAKEGSAESEHFTTYNGMLNVTQLKGGWQRYNQKELNKEILEPFGYGDGGGGPTREMLENAERMRYGIPGCPAVKQTTVTDFFHTLEQNTTGSKELPAWVGELYLEYHRGTYTSMARNKRMNRRAEFALMNAETASVLAALLGGLVFPEEALYADWDVVLRNQFHDILPGSAIKEVYDESKEEYETVLRDAAGKVNTALQTILPLAGERKTLVGVNLTGFEASALVEQPMSEEDAQWLQANGYAFQEAADGNVLIPVCQLPAKGYAPVQPVAASGAEVTISAHGVETRDLRVVIDDNGHFTSIYDKQEGRELLKAGEVGNTLVTYEDHPHNFDNWDINNYYTEKAWPVEDVTGIRVTENGPFRYAIEISYRYLSSTIVQDLYFYPEGTRFDIHTRIDWHERQILLKNWFPVDIHASEASYEIQFGNVTRPTHYNTSWDEARFEVCAQKWLDLSENGYGLSIMNDCKYGCSIHDGQIGLTLLKSGIFPNPEADKEQHEFTYAFLLHKDGWREARTEQQANILNNPPMLVIAGGDVAPFSLVRCVDANGNEQPNIVVEAVTKALDEDAIIIRAYEYQNRRTRCRLVCGLPIASAEETDLLENKTGEVTATDNTMETTFLPYQIKTFKVRFQQNERG